MMGSRRLQTEAKALKKTWGTELIRARPDVDNLYEFHFVVEGAPETVYEGGFYHGMLRFPPEYPMKPPSVFMYTPSGRFETNKRLCLSISDYHPESWNPVWSVGTIIQGLISFMSSEDVTAGSITTDNQLRRQLASSSLKYNVKNRKFAQLFPDLLKLHSERQSRAPAAAAGASGGASSLPSRSSLADADAGVDHPHPQAVATAGAAADEAQRKADEAGVCGSGFTGFSLFVAGTLMLAVLFVLLGDSDVDGANGSADYEL